MKLPEELKNRIIKALKPIDPYRVILFGSYAWGEPSRDSDIDLYIITKDDYFPKNFHEKMDLKLKVAYAIDSIRNDYPVDLIVHTKPMAERFIELDSSFARELIQRGEKLL